MDPYTRYYARQCGHGLPFYKGVAVQRGHGLGSILKGGLRLVSQTLGPLVGGVVKSVAGDVLQGRNFGESIRQHGLEGASRGLQDLIARGANALKRKVQSGSGRPRKVRRRAKTGTKKGRKKKKGGKGAGKGKRRKRRKVRRATVDIFS